MIPFIYAANWKMHKTPEETKAFFLELTSRDIYLGDDGQTMFFVPALNMQACAESLVGSQHQWGGQNCHFEKQGAFTGENSPEVLKLMGATCCLVGHSERRSIFSETDEILAKKVAAIFEQGLTPILCVGEALWQRRAGKTQEVIIDQLRKGLSEANGKTNFIVAYEPVWAIGTGVVADQIQVEEAHSWLREELTNMSAPLTPILYGGSVKPESAGGLKQVPNVNGFLIGGASLKTESFIKIIEA